MECLWGGEFGGRGTRWKSVEKSRRGDAWELDNACGDRKVEEGKERKGI